MSQNWHVQSGLNLASIHYALTTVVPSNWTPLTYLTELVTVQFFGSSSMVLHTLCALLHTANVALLYLFLRKATRLFWASAIVAMLWGWHPLRAESAAWVGELRDVLCGFFWLAAMIAYASFRARASLGRYAAVFACTALAMLAKPMAVTLPASLLLLDHWPLRSEDQCLNAKYWKRRSIELLPLFLLCAFISLVAVETQAMSGTVGSLSDFPMGLRITNAIVSYLQYISKQCIPIHLGLIYPHPGMLGKAVPVYEWACPALVLLGISLAVWRSRQSRPYLLVGWFWFVGNLIPVIGLVQFGQAAMADRYTYVPAMGFTIMIVWIFAQAVSERPRYRMLVGIATAICIIALFGMSFRQISYWTNNTSLMAHSNDVIPDNFLARSSLSMDASAAGDYQRAIDLAQSAVSLVPTNQEAHHALAQALAGDKQTPQALAEYVTAIRLDPNHPGLRFEVGTLLAQQGRLVEGIKQFQKAVDLDPAYVDARNNLALALARHGEIDAAITQWQTVLQLNPNFGAAHGMLADALRLRGDRSGAIEHYRAALANGQTNPNWKANLAWEVAIDPSSTTDQLTPLAEIAQQACQQTQNQQPFPLYAYSLVLARLNRFDDAITAASAADHLAQATNQTQMAKAIRTRIEAYKQGLIIKTP